MLNLMYKLNKINIASNKFFYVYAKLDGNEYFIFWKIIYFFGQAGIYKNICKLNIKFRPFYLDYKILKEKKDVKETQLYLFNKTKVIFLITFLNNIKATMFVDLKKIISFNFIYKLKEEGYRELKKKVSKFADENKLILFFVIIYYKNHKKISQNYFYKKKLLLLKKNYLNCNVQICYILKNKILNFTKFINEKKK